VDIAEANPEFVDQLQSNEILCAESEEEPENNANLINNSLLEILENEECQPEVDVDAVTAGEETSIPYKSSIWSQFVLYCAFFFSFGFLYFQNYALEVYEGYSAFLGKKKLDSVFHS